MNQLTESTTDALHAMRLVGSSSHHAYPTLSHLHFAVVYDDEFLVGPECTSDPSQSPLLSLDGSATEERPSVEHTYIDDLRDGCYELLLPIPVHIRPVDVGEFEASFDEANIAIGGTDRQDALQALVCEILDTFDVFMDAPRLGPGPENQLQVLCTYIARA
ncbi:MAG: hypothetical protein OXG74_11945 [Acidobacteria bacterium]|nr:hypothetical protein [Acidobacteriota bacterium]